MRRLADQVVTGSRDVGEMLRRARRGEEDDALRRTRGEMEARWGDVAGHLEAVAARYDDVYQQLQRERTTG
jgi:pyridoxal biosynthesis lyase PdxS